jgi:apolipoprotein N-acyltransferase
MTKIAFLKDAGLAALSGAVLVLAFPVFDFAVGAWVGLVPLLIALEEKSLKVAFLLSWLTGWVLFPGICSWIWSVDAFNLLDFTLLGGYLALYVGLWGVSLVWIRRQTGLSSVLVAPPLWVTFEYLRSHMSFLSAPWMLLGHSQYPHLLLIQMTAVTGVFGLSFLIVLVNTVITELLLYLYGQWVEPTTLSTVEKFPGLALGVAATLFAAVLLYGFQVFRGNEAGQSLSVALVQGNIAQERKWRSENRQAILDQYAVLTRKAAEQLPALILWPETAVPGDVQHNPELRQLVSNIARNVNIPLLVGSGEKAMFTDRKLISQYYNAMVLFSSGGEITNFYRKIALVPFGEYVPLRDLVSWPEAIASAMGDYLPGERSTLFTVGQTNFGSVICWELIFPELFRESVKQGAQFMVIATNEAWFGRTSAPYQLLAMSVFRAVENRRAIVRVANTGVSALIDPFGRIIERLRGTDQQDLFVEGILTGNIPLVETKTFYTQYGDVFALLQIAASVAFFLFAGTRSDSKRQANLCQQ